MGIGQIRPIHQATHRHQAGQVHRPVHFVQIPLGETELPQQEMHQLFRAVVCHLQAHGIAKTTAQQFATQCGGEVFQIVFQLQVGVPG